MGGDGGEQRIISPVVKAGFVKEKSWICKHYNELDQDWLKESCCFFFPLSKIVLFVLYCDFSPCNLFSKAGIQNGKGNLNNADWPLGREEWLMDNFMAHL